MIYKERLEYLDSLRGIAALLVVFQHLYVPILDMDFFRYFIDFGKVGIVWFFIISGMVIPFTLHRKTTARKFITSRFFRLYPAYWLSLIAYIFSLFLLGLSIPPAYTIAANITMIQTALGEPDVIGVYWTLFIEIVFYSICLFLFLINKIDNNVASLLCIIIFTTIAIVLSIVRSVYNIKAPVALPLALSLMFFGSIWREATISNLKNSKLLSAVILIFFLVSFPLIFYLAYSKDMGYGENFQRYFWTYLMAITSFLVFSSKIKLSSRMLIWLGSISYSVYLFHPLIYMTMIHLLERYNYSYGLFSAAIATLLTLLISSFVYLYIEKKFLEIGKRINKRADLTTSKT